MRFRPTVVSFVILVAGLGGYWLARSAAPEATPVVKKQMEQPLQKVPVREEMPNFRRGERLKAIDSDREAFEAGALQGQRIVVFKDQAGLLAFLERAGDKVRVMGRLDALNALRIGFLDYSDLAALLDGSEETSFVFPVEVPSPTEAIAQPGAIALEDQLLNWLGITADNSTWGSGVRIAILDTGVSSHSSFGGKIKSINLVDLSADPSAWNGHGTAVASVIIGKSSTTPGVAPGAEVVSIRVADDQGQSDSFLLAKGIIAAADSGAQLINISMGSYGDSALVRNAIAYAKNAGAVIVAAAGNDGTNRLAYPAANEGVIAVGAVDAAGNHLSFSNTGNSLAVSAPGYGINAAWTGDSAVRVDGTSFSSPIIVGTLAAIMNNGSGRISASEAVNRLFANLNDAGSAGQDSTYGGGMPAFDRVMNANTRGIYDAAVASHTIISPSKTVPYPQVALLVQNRGTETLVNTSVTLTSTAGKVSANVPTLAPNAVHTVNVPLSQNSFSSGQSIQFDSRVVISSGRTDSNPSNNRRVETFTPTVR